ncbi:UDP-N-acetylmuramate--L-alanine ligase [Galbibacter sp.]|jgi:UDP-N-acetylmuramate--alanine ligase|uniref:UDP-N-acetylmuramate--L-alanine ligase n=1 Tax=Galbibacter sp. TaxID=2918471 RepID=UPI003A8D3A94
MSLKETHNVYFIGIGGIGMSALARYFKFTGMNVAGYDRVASPITEGLIEDGMAVHYQDSVDLIGEAFKDPEYTLVVYTPAVKNNAEYGFFENGNFTIEKRAAVLGRITKDSYCFAVAGTHGKTTTSTILAHLLNEINTPLTAFLGGVSENFNSNFIIKGKQYTVVEADEFDRSFLHLSPTVACITSMDADHLDIYGDSESLELAFKEFAGRLKDGGTMFVRYGLPIEGYTYGLEEEADYSAQNITITDSTYQFDFKTPKETVSKVKFNKPGKHNLLNALAAMAMATTLGTPLGHIAKALESFKGIKRRFTYHINDEKLVYIDDYAHHPTEIDAAHQAVRSAHPNKKVTVVFQPHLYSRTKDFAQEFAKSLANFDEIILLEIYPAREQPIEGVDSDWLLSLINHGCKQKVAKENLPDVLRKSTSEVYLTLGAGDIGLEVNSVKEVLSEKVY